MDHFNWAPGIGDPTFGGWLTVALYFLAAISCWITLRKLAVERGSSANEQRVWVSLSALMLALGVNKQLDLQTALTEAGRLLARYQGWHNQRQSVQVVFIGLIAIVCVVALIILLIWSRKSAPPVWLALSGAAMVLGFVLIRASSFHHVDSLIGARFLGVRWNHLIEIGGIGVILWASLSRQLDLEIDLRLGVHHREWIGLGDGLDYLPSALLFVGGTPASKYGWLSQRLALTSRWWPMAQR